VIWLSSLHDVHTKFHKNPSTGSRDIKGGYTCTHDNDNAISIFVWFQATITARLPEETTWHSVMRNKITLTRAKHSVTASGIVLGKYWLLCVLGFGTLLNSLFILYESYEMWFSQELSGKFRHKFYGNSVLRTRTSLFKKVRSTVSLLDKKPARNHSLLTEEELDELRVGYNIPQKSLTRLAKD
jgi:hypothetical protein